MPRFTNEEIIQRFREVHGDYFCYKKVVYVNSDTKVCIIDPEYGEFWIRYDHHINGAGHQKAGRVKQGLKRRLTTEEFIERCEQIDFDGVKYDYSKANLNQGSEKLNYENRKVCIIHPKFGEHWICPFSHLSGAGHPKAGLLRSSKLQASTTEEFIEKCEQIDFHGIKYDYSKVDYVNAWTKVCIIHPEHGEHWINPASHLIGCGHPDAGKRRAGLKRRLTTEEFIERCEQIDFDGVKYDYSKANLNQGSEKLNYENRKVCIIHPEHGEHWICPFAHLSGAGHPDAGNIKQGLSNRLTTEEFIERCKQIDFDGVKYDYSKVVYVKSHLKVCIIHPKYGEHWIQPSNHLNGNGHPDACHYGFDAKKPGRFYVYHIHELNLLKFGISNYTVDQRVRHKYEYTTLIDVLFEVGQSALDMESEVKYGGAFKTHQSKVVFDGYTETLKYSDLHDIEEFVEMSLEFFDDTGIKYERL